jgi:hypothetical protein
MSKITRPLAILALGILTLAPAAHAPLLELDSCHDDLDRLRRTASDASDSAEDAKSKSDEFDDCRRDPEFHDLTGGGCRNKRNDYQSALTDLESKMDDLDSRLRSVQSSCGYEFTINRMSDMEASQRRLEAAKRRLCVSLKNLISLGMTPNAALQMCKANADEQLCKACLGLR